MIKVGITGGIGSGKSVVCELLRVYGYPVYDADDRAKELNNTSPIIRDKLISHFGKDLYPDNKLDKKKLANIIFTNPDNLKIANSIIHPEVAKDFIKWILEREKYAIVFMDAAVLLEAGFNKILDKVITVYAPYTLRLQRASERDKTDIKNIAERAKNQLSEEERIKLSDYVIYNDDTQSLIEQVATILRTLCNE
ncbi:MAG: dephospho-CoA kinase [Dysgonamonadaceae bacterium]|mgnify:FL=1|jgi:dephospho-CoA kinase|nr:dephospho-CoA kinase [Dysgonamonadaceae bacterium]MDD3308698.1 dephospho-CoA kinase [Dysgonamonadaceae bacterium]MDD3901083.1 dephospho-CoA kinase [Dysgonamonadaceae bacterium]MDD4399620.1 dephospho-CoA kinase [Dysgonamonadaceae bacterium]MEA5080252.1 dephospho-CoA kinase [Dysgonamonadaceae bacterium]